MKSRSPLSARQVLDRYFLENRARLLELAAFLDRIDRCHDAEAVRRDPRVMALRRGIERLGIDRGNRTADTQLAFTDPTTEPLSTAAGLQGPTGAWEGRP